MRRQGYTGNIHKVGYSNYSVENVGEMRMRTRIPRGSILNSWDLQTYKFCSVMYISFRFEGAGSWSSSRTVVVPFWGSKRRG